MVSLQNLVGHQIEVLPSLMQSIQVSKSIKKRTVQQNIEFIATGASPKRCRAPGLIRAALLIQRLFEYMLVAPAFIEEHRSEAS